jgi:NAD(P)-dependent dehydrogenase (short-subunit alcohol dehydrogenase family)
MQTPGELAELIAFCMSPAGDYITGSVIVADGGVEFARGTVRLP